MELRAKPAENFSPGGYKSAPGGNQKILGLGGSSPYWPALRLWLFKILPTPTPLSFYHLWLPEILDQYFKILAFQGTYTASENSSPIRKYACFAHIVKWGMSNSGRWTLFLLAPGQRYKEITRILCVCQKNVRTLLSKLGG